jgi:hypothetical protein
MIRVLKTLLLWFLIATMPVQGIAAVVQASCGPRHHDMPSMAMGTVSIIMMTGWRLITMMRMKVRKLLLAIAHHPTKPKHSIQWLISLPPAARVHRAALAQPRRLP